MYVKINVIIVSQENEINMIKLQKKSNSNSEDIMTGMSLRFQVAG